MIHYHILIDQVVQLLSVVGHSRHRQHLQTLHQIPLTNWSRVVNRYTPLFQENDGKQLAYHLIFQYFIKAGHLGDLTQFQLYYNRPYLFKSIQHIFSYFLYFVAPHFYSPCLVPIDPLTSYLKTWGTGHMSSQFCWFYRNYLQLVDWKSLKELNVEHPEWRMACILIGLGKGQKRQKKCTERYAYTVPPDPFWQPQDMTCDWASFTNHASETETAWWICWRCVGPMVSEMGAAL